MKRCTKCGAERPVDDFYMCAGRPYSHCKPCVLAQRKAEYAVDGERLRAKNRRLKRAARAEALQHYGGRCVCCGENEPAFLAIDHVNGGGTRHRRDDPLSNNIYLWLRKRGYPAEGFQVLCHNCNMAKAFYGTCPHVEDALPEAHRIFLD